MSASLHRDSLTPMGPQSRHISAWMERTADEVYEYASSPANLPEWAAGLGTSVELVDGRWIADSPMGRVEVAFAERNAFGVLDHNVTLPSGETVYNPMRVIPGGSRSCEVVFTLRRRPGVTDAELASDAATVAADLARLERALMDR
jgi:hypothetical protein